MTNGGVMRARIDPDVVQWRDADAGREGSHLLVLLHGFGSNEHDLFSLAPSLPSNLTIASLRAPIEMESNPFAPAGAYSWFDLLGEHPGRDQIDASVRAVIVWLDGLRERFASVGVLGFSQGGAMCLQLARTIPDRISYLVELSGFVHTSPHEGDAVLAAMEPRIPALQAWGSADPVVPIEMTRATSEWMTRHLDVEAYEYPMQHAVVQEEIDDIADFLRRVTSTA